MAWTRLQSAYNTATSQNSVSATFPGSCTPGSLIVAFLGCDGSTLLAGYSTSDGVNATYTKDADNTGGSGASGLAINSQINASSTALTVTISLGAVMALTRILIQEWTGNVASSPFDAGNGAGTGSSTTPTSNNITTAAANELLVGLGCAASVGTWTQGSGYTLDPNSPAGTKFSVEYNVSNSSGSNNATFSLGGSLNWQCAIAAYKAQASNTANINWVRA